MAGLEGRHRGSKPRAATPAVQARVIRRVQQKPGDGSTHWSCRKLAKELGLSKSTVQRILVQAQLQPHRLERYLASDHPDLLGSAPACGRVLRGRKDRDSGSGSAGP